VDSTSQLSGPGGVVMMEVAVAVLLVGIAVTGLAAGTQRAIAAAAAVRDDATVAAVAAWESSKMEEWGWGPMVRHAEWSPGPKLELHPHVPSAERGAIGIWADGWSLGEWLAEDVTVTQIGQEVWAGRVGEAVTVRIRNEDGAWGPPWRTIVPDVYAQMPDSLRDQPATEPQVSTGGQGVAVHVPFVARPEILGTWSSEPLHETLAGLVYLSSPPYGDTLGVTLDGRTQWWKPGKEGLLDVYF